MLRDDLDAVLRDDLDAVLRDLDAVLRDVDAVVRGLDAVLRDLVAELPDLVAELPDLDADAARGFLAAAAAADLVDVPFVVLPAMGASPSFADLSPRHYPETRLGMRAQGALPRSPLW